MPRKPTPRIAAALVAASIPLALGPPALADNKERPTGLVFLPNAIVALQDQSLTDQNDADYPALAGAYEVVRIRNLDHSGYLRGDFADACAATCAFSKKERFFYDRSEKGFEQVMAYYAVTRAQRYIRSLGFTDVNEGVQTVRIRAGFDQSYYDPVKDEIQLGRGGVDDGEDMEIIWHEYGHAIQVDQVPGFGESDDALAIGEGFADYWAYTMSEPQSDGYDPACIADWDSVSYTSTEPHCLRRVDLDLTVADRTGDPHDDGQIWSRALYDIHQQLGRATTDTIVLTSHWSFAVDAGFADAALATVAAAQSLYGTPEATIVRSAFEARGIL
jgi:hypothetical protein